MGKTILITGGGQGLGLSIVKKHRKSGDVVFALDKNLSDELKKEIGTEGAALCCDISSDESVRQAADAIKQKTEYIDIIYNVAGIFSEAGRVGIKDTDLKLCARMMEINAYGMVRICKYFWERIHEKTLVLNISSEAGSIGAARRNGEYGYCMSKAALNMASKLLSNELWEKGGRVLCVHPGWMKTKMGGEAAQKSDRAVFPEESAEAIVGLAEGIEDIPRDQMYMTYQGEILPW